MTHQVYKEMLVVMKKRGGAFCAMDIPEFYAMVKALFTPEEAELNNAMPRGPFTASDMAGITGKDETEVHETLEAMAGKGLCLALNVGGTDYYQSARFAPGIMEFQFMPGRTTDRDKKLARLIHTYKEAHIKANPPTVDEFPTTRVNHS